MLGRDVELLPYQKFQIMFSREVIVCSVFQFRFSEAARKMVSIQAIRVVCPSKIGV
jgi:hypothetical protein